MAKETGQILKDFVAIWSIPVKYSDFETLRFIGKRINKLGLGEILIQSMIKFKSQIQKRIDELEKTTIPVARE